jgi:hypothetical protein
MFEVNGDYKFDIDDEISVYGNQKYTDCSMLLGHMINDSASFQGDDTMNDEQIKIEMSKYVSNATNNAQFCVSDDKTIVYVVAIKNIPPNSEIFASYGFWYWI